ncbi:MAG: hypothetical protein JWM81_850 [Candidatus Saccharibacteria bacterium]|nr:hypothetical protein [Candidatus Saccharibacteria bacterium]
MTTENTNLTKLIELANHYPSPHNGQPIELRQLSAGGYELCFETKRGLQAAEVSYLFSYVTMGVFITHLEFCAAALGYDISCSLALPPVSALKGDGSIRFATCQIIASEQAGNSALLDTLRFRQTSRKKYFEGVDDELSDKMISLAAAKNLELVKMDRAGTHQAIWLNQRAVFDDMFDDAVREELNHWLRYSKQEKETKKDGLAYDCMELSGRAMKFIVKHYKILRMPGVSRLLQQYYLRTMSDNSDAYYLLTPFSNEQEAYEVGVAVMQLWEAVADKRYYLHPFGTIMSNQAAHDDFLKLAHIEHEDIHKNFLVFIFRCGKSEKPHTSLRIPVEEHLLRSERV